MNPIGVFDSGYGGLTILQKMRELLPEYDYVYLGDNARTPYGNRSFEIVYQFTREAVKKLFDMGCPLVIIACNTASAKALRSIQQNDLPCWDVSKRVLGVIRSTAEVIGQLSKSRHVGIVATAGTITSESYVMEIRKLFPDITVTGRACPMWVPLVENDEMEGPGADYFIKKDIDALFAMDSMIDTVILGCTHYPLLLEKIKKYVPQGTTIIPQGEYVAKSLCDYLHRHPEMDARLTRGAICRYFTTENADKFGKTAKMFLGEDVLVEHLSALDKNQ